jgi:predicted PolB exonuclease-like 3'-5' exonuclease
MTTLVFDIETVPDTDLGRRLYDLHDLSDEQVGQIMFTKRRQETGNDFLSHEQHRVIAISVVMRSREALKVWSLGDENASEKELIERFFDGVDKFTPELVSWNGSGFDLPVLHYRSLLHGVTAARYWETGDGDSSFRFSNYLSRFHWRHMDLMDVLSGFQGRGRASLDAVATLLGLPGKVGMQGSQVWDVYLNGGLKRIRDYCETDVLNTYLVYLRFQLLRGHLNLNEHAH